MKNTENKDIEKIKDLLGAVKVPFSKYKDTYNKMCNTEDQVVDMNEDSQEATIIENAILKAAEEGILTANEAFELLVRSIAAFLSYGNLLGFIFKDKKGTIKISKFNVTVRI